MSDILKSLEGIHKQLDDNKKTPDNNVYRDIIKSDASTFDKKANVKATLTSLRRIRRVRLKSQLQLKKQDPCHKQGLLVIKRIKKVGHVLRL